MADELRDYQKTVIKKTFNAFENGLNSVMVQMPTGTGKTHVFAETVRKWTSEVEKNKKVLILAHRTELIDQIIDRLKRFSIIGSAIKSGKVADENYQVQVAMIQSLKKETRLPKNISLLVIDEAHHSSAKSYKKVIYHYKVKNSEVKIIGFTATPWRLSGAGFSDIYDKLITSKSIKSFIEEGNLSNLKHFAASSLDLRSIKIDRNKKDYSEVELEECVRNEVVLAELIDSYKNLANGKKTIVFALNRRHSKDIVERYNREGIRAEFIDATTDKIEREKLVKQFRDGEIRILCNVNIFTEGFDCPDVEVVQLARPTKSLSLYLQQVGRVMRPNEDKEFGIIIDNACLHEEHGLVTQPFSWSLEYASEEEARKKLAKKRIELKKASLPTEISGIDLMEIFEEREEFAPLTEISSLGIFNYYFVDINSLIFQQENLEFNTIQKRLNSVLSLSFNELENNTTDILEESWIESRNDNLELVLSKGKFGIRNIFSNQLVLSCNFDFIEKPNLLGFSIVKKGKQFGVFDSVNHKLIIPTIYDEIAHSNNVHFLECFKVKLGSNFGVVSKTNRVIIAVEYKQLLFIDTMINAQNQRSHWRLFDKDLKIIRENLYEHVFQLKTFQVIKYNNTFTFGLNQKAYFPFTFIGVEKLKNNLFLFTDYSGLTGIMEFPFSWLVSPIYTRIIIEGDFIIALGENRALFDEFGKPIVESGFTQLDFYKETPIIKDGEGWHLLINGEKKFTNTKKNISIQQFENNLSKNRKSNLKKEKKIEKRLVQKKFELSFNEKRIADKQKEQELKASLESIYLDIEKSDSYNYQDDSYKRINEIAFEFKTKTSKLLSIIELLDLKDIQFNSKKINNKQYVFLKEAINFIKSNEYKL